MSWNMPDGCSPSDYDRWMGYDQPDEPVTETDDDSELEPGEDRARRIINNLPAPTNAKQAEVHRQLRRMYNATHPRAEQLTVEVIWEAVDKILGITPTKEDAA